VVAQILGIGLGHDDAREAGAAGGEDFLLDAADGQDRPVSVISPVMAVSLRAGFFE
jgi:hypothetical protein